MANEFKIKNGLVVSGSAAHAAQCGCDRVERAGQVGAHRGDGGDDDDRDERGDQAVFDGGGAGFVLSETRDELGHGEFPCVYV